MIIHLSPQRSDAPLSVSRDGDVLTIGAEAFDFGPLPDGATLPREAVNCPWLASDVQRIDGELHLTLILPHGPNAPEAARFPASIVDPPDGPVFLPQFGA
jgi:hypothetical protein